MHEVPMDLFGAVNVGRRLWRWTIPTTFEMLRSNVRTALLNVGCEENNCRFVRLMREVSEG
jgi:hypothetical protein